MNALSGSVSNEGIRVSGLASSTAVIAATGFFFVESIDFDVMLQS